MATSQELNKKGDSITPVKKQKTSQNTDEDINLKLESASTEIQQVAPVQFSSPETIQKMGFGSTYSTNAGIDASNMQVNGPVFMARDHMTINLANCPMQSAIVTNSNNKDLLLSVSQTLSNLKKLYGRHYSLVKPFPWLSRECVANLKEHFCTLHLVTRSARMELRQSKTDAPIPELLSKLRKCTPLNLCEIFNPDINDEPRRILIEGEPGIGKTSLCVKLATDWSQEVAYIAEKFKGVFFIRARNAKAGLKECICAALRMNKAEVEQLWECMLDEQYENLFLFIIDGLDEVTHSLPQEFIELIEGRLFCNSCVLVTSRTNQWQSKLLSPTDSLDFDSRLFDREIINVGFTQKTAFEFINTVGSVKREESQIETLQEFILQHEFLEDLIRSPLICIFLCTMWNENYIITGMEEDQFRRTFLYANMVECLVKRYCQHTNESDYKLVKNKFSSATLVKLGQIYQVAYFALQEGKVQVSLEDIERYLNIFDLSEEDVMFSFGILVKESEFLDFNEEIVFAFPHRTVQEELSSEFYVTSEKKLTETEYIINNFPLVCIFSSGLLIHRNLDPSLLIPLFGEMTNKFITNFDMNDENNVINVALECVYESRYQTLLVNVIAASLPHSLILKSPSTSVVCGLFKCLESNKTLVNSVGAGENTYAVLSKVPPVINILGLASVFKNNRVLKALSLSGVLELTTKKGIARKAIDDSSYRLGWENFKEGLNTNTSLTELNLPSCEISDRGWEALGGGLKTNTALKEFDVELCKIPAIGWKSLGEALQVNRALTRLNLSYCEIPDRGWEALRDSLKVNTALTELYLGNCDISDQGGKALGESLKINTVLTKLDLSWSRIPDTVWEALGNAVKENKALTSLNLSRCKISDLGSVSLREALISNTALTQLDLHSCRISESGWEALGVGLKDNRALTQLDLHDCKILDKGEESLGMALKGNSVLLELNLSECKFSDRGWEFLGESLRTNKVLTHLNLSECEIPDNRCETLGDMIMSNKTMIQLDLQKCKISDSGWKTLGEKMKVNTTLKILGS